MTKYHMHVDMNNTQLAYRQNLQILLAVHGSYSGIAKAIGFDRAYLYRNKGCPTPKLQRRIATEAGLIRLREFIKLLRKEYGVSNRDAQRLMLSSHSRLIDHVPP